MSCYKYESFRLLLYNVVHSQGCELDDDFLFCMNVNFVCSCLAPSSGLHNHVESSRMNLNVYFLNMCGLRALSVQSQQF